MTSICDTAEILDKASPRKPREEIWSKSSTFWILLVACLKKARGTCSLGIPSPLSVTRIREIPPSLISTVTAVAPASMAFSTNSLTTEAGRSTTSPAAILSIVFWSKTAIFLNFYHHLFFSLFCSRYNIFKASTGRSSSIWMDFSSSSTSSSFTVSKREICSISTWS